jgi:hypothetical protein
MSLTVGFVGGFLHTFFSPGIIRYCKFILHISCPNPEIRNFTKKSQFLLENVRNQDLGARCTYCFWGVIASWCSQLWEQRGRCVHTYHKQFHL